MNKNLDLQAIPVVLKHMTLAIYENKFGSAAGKSNFSESFLIARSRLTEYGHLTSTSIKGPVTKIQLTGSGKKFEADHRKEAGSKKKSAKFDVLYDQFIALKPKTVPEKRGGA